MRLGSAKTQVSLLAVSVFIRSCGSFRLVHKCCHLRFFVQPLFWCPSMFFLAEPFRFIDIELGRRVVFHLSMLGAFLAQLYC